MTRKLIFILPLASLLMLSACDKEEKTRLQTENDSLRSELETSQKVAATLQEVGVLMDSIDASRQILKVNMVEGTTYDDYTSRMKDINSYVRETERKITDLEKEMQDSKSKSAGLAKTVKTLKNQLKEKTEELALMQEEVNKVRAENQDLTLKVDLQAAEISDKEAEIVAKQQELALIEARIQELMIQSKMTEADAYFARAAAIEEAANRTHLAPRKKKETLKEAIELYKKAQSLGNTQAQAKIDELEKKVS